MIVWTFHTICRNILSDLGMTFTRQLGFKLQWKRSRTHCCSWPSAVQVLVALSREYRNCKATYNCSRRRGTAAHEELILSDNPTSPKFTFKAEIQKYLLNAEAKNLCWRMRLREVRVVMVTLESWRMGALTLRIIFWTIDHFHFDILKFSLTQ